MNDVDRIKQMVEAGQITQEEADQLIAVLREVDAAGERLAAAGSAGASGARVSEPELDDEEFDQAFDQAFDAEYDEYDTVEADEARAPEAEAREETGMAPGQSQGVRPAASMPAEGQSGEPASHPGPVADPPRQPAQPTGPVTAAAHDGGQNFDTGQSGSATETASPGSRAGHANASQDGSKNVDDDAARRARTYAEHAAHARAREQANEAAQQAREAAREAARRARDAARDAMRSARDSARETAREARRASREASRATRDATRAVTAGIGSTVDRVDEAGRPGVLIAPAGTKWVTIEMLAGELEVETVPGLSRPAAEGGPGEFTINETADGYSIQFMPDRGNFIDRFVSSLKSGDLKVQLPPGYGLNVVATAGDVRIRGVKYLRGRMRAGELQADELRGVDFSMTAGEFSSTLVLDAGHHVVSLGAGDLNVYLPDDANVRLSGRVSIGDAGTNVQGLSRSGSGLGGTVDGTLGTGAATVDLSVTTGDLDVRYARRRDG